MKLHFLISISSDTENLYGVRFFSEFFAGADRCNVTLFHISRLDSKDCSSMLMEVWRKPDEDLEISLSEQSRRALAMAQRTLENNDVSIEEVKTRIVRERFGKVRDILKEGNDGLYDAIILGCRATYALQWLFDRPGDQIAQALIQDTSLNCPLWVCSELAAGRKNVLLCIDGSESALRAADHVGYILTRVKHQRVTLFQVASSTAGNGEDSIEQARKTLLSHGIAAGRISAKKRWSLSVSGAILREVADHGYAAVAIGLHGTPEKGLLAGLTNQGGTAGTLVHKITGAALWICP